MGPNLGWNRVESGYETVFWREEAELKIVVGYLGREVYLP